MSVAILLDRVALIVQLGAPRSPLSLSLSLPLVLFGWLSTRLINLPII